MNQNKNLALRLTGTTSNTDESQRNIVCENLTTKTVKIKSGSNKDLKQGYVLLDIEKEIQNTSNSIKENKNLHIAYSYILDNVVNPNFYIENIEKQLIQENYFLQGGFDLPPDTELDDLINKEVHKSLSSKLFGWFTRYKMDQIEYPLKLVEDIALFIANISFSTTKTQFTLACINFLKARSNRSFCREILENLDYIHEYIARAWQLYSKTTNEYTDDSDSDESVFLFSDDDDIKPELQGGITNKLKKYIDFYKSARYGTTFKKCKNLVIHLTALSIFKPMGYDLTHLGYTALEKEALERSTKRSPDALVQIIETIIYIVERIEGCIEHGSMSPLLDGQGVVDKFFKDYALLQDIYKVLDYPSLLTEKGYSECQFIELLEAAIDSGDGITKYLHKDVDKKVVGTYVDTLKAYRVERLSRKFASQPRQVPFSILLYGESGIGKSSIQDILFNYYGVKAGIPVTPDFRFTKNPVAKFWNNFRSHKWCIILDDIGFLNPKVAAAGDPTCMEVIQIVNGIEFIPDQADLELKGRHPLLAKLVIGSTNTKHMNAANYFAFPTAMQRRFPYVVIPTIRKEYAAADGTLNPSLAPQVAEGAYPNMWTFTVQKPLKRSVLDRERQYATGFETILKDVDLFTFLQWYNEAIDTHNYNQNKASQASNGMQSVTLCKQCFIPEKMCNCDRISEIDMRLDLQELSVYDWFYWWTGIPQWWNIVQLAYFEYILKGFAFMRLYSLWLCMTIGFGSRMDDFADFIWVHSTYGLNAVFGRYMPCSILKFFHSTEQWYFVHRVEFCENYPNVYKYMIAKNIRSKLRRAKNLLVIFGSLTFCIYMLQKILKMTGIIGNNPLPGYKKPEPEVVNVSQETMKNLEEKIKESNMEIASIHEYLKKHEIKVEEPKKDSEIQGKTERKPLPQSDEVPNVWYKENFNLTALDLGKTTLSWNALSEAQIKDKLSNNVVLFKVHISSGHRKVTRATCISGQIYMFNLHILKDVPEVFCLDIYYQGTTKGISPNITVTLNKSTIIKRESHDLAFVEIRGVPPRRDITDLFSKVNTGLKIEGYYISRYDNGNVDFKEVHRIRSKNIYVDQLGRNIDSWEGIVGTGTESGFCGSLLVGRTGFGPVILGIHYLGHQDLTVVAAIAVDQTYLQGIISRFKPQVQESSFNIGSDSVQVGLTDLSAKSAFRYLEEGSAQVYGSLTLPKASGKSCVQPTMLHEDFKAIGIHSSATKPDLKSWRPWHLAAKEMVKPANNFDPVVIQECVDAYIQDILSVVPQEELEREVMVYDTFTSINGAAGVAYVDSINRHTSIGHPYNKSKRHFIIELEPQHGLNNPIDFTDEIKKQIEDIEDNGRKGYRANPCFRGNLKDEAVSELKAEMGKTRAFAGAPAAWSVVNRKYTLSMVRLIQRNPLLFECACGMTAQSQEWDWLCRHITGKNPTRMIAGDFAKFDKSMCAEFIQGAFDILIAIAKRSNNYDDEDIMMLRTIACDTAFCFMNFNGDLVQFYGTNPSGHPLTVIINSLVNSLYFRYMFKSITNKPVSDFRKYVTLITYGDDNVANVSDDLDGFNHTTIQAEFAKFNIKYTMADKEAESIPFIDISEVSFLKRSFRYNERLGKIVGPLDESSIHKMLSVWVKSRSISEQEQMVAVCASAMQEYFFYGEEKFHEMENKIMPILEKHFLLFYTHPSTFQTYNCLCDRYKISGRKSLGLPYRPTDC
jgi:hypothetical protein